MKNRNVNVKASFKGLFSYGNTFLFISYAAVVVLFIFSVKNSAKLPYAPYIFLILGLAFLALIICSLIKIFISKGEAGPPSVVLRDGDRSLTIINYILAAGMIDRLMPKPLPAPEALLEGKATEEKMKKLSPQEKTDWQKQDEKKMIGQILEQLKKPAEKEKLSDETVASENK